MTTAYPLAWPEGWPRTQARKAAHFGKVTSEKSAYSDQVWDRKRPLSIEDAAKRIRAELKAMGVNVADDSIISTNLRLNMAGLPRGDQGAPADPGVAVYWQKTGKPMRVMAIDIYNRVADNMAAIAATLNAMRAIERHGGAQVLERAFTGFSALPPPKHWSDILGVPRTATADQVTTAYRERARKAHPDAGGSTAAMAEINAARDAAFKEIGA
jgi:hypothetical protein